jgi:arginine/lysine/ornithine decarboxylase
MGFEVCGGEPLKITVRGASTLADHLRESGIEVEFSDSEYTVLMLTPENTDEDIDNLLRAFSVASIDEMKVEKRLAITPHHAEMTIRNAIFSPCESVSAEKSAGRICATPTVSCPPAVPIVISGERITAEDVKLFKHYGIERINVVIE